MEPNASVQLTPLSDFIVEITVVSVLTQASERERAQWVANKDEKNYLQCPEIGADWCTHISTTL